MATNAVVDLQDCAGQQFAVARQADWSESVFAATPVAGVALQPNNAVASQRIQVIEDVCRVCLM